MSVIISQHNEDLPCNVGTVLVNKPAAVVIRWDIVGSTTTAFTRAEYKYRIKVGMLQILAPLYKVVRKHWQTGRYASFNYTHKVFYSPGEVTTGIDNTPVLCFEHLGDAELFRKQYFRSGIIFKGWAPWYEYKCWVGAGSFDPAQWWASSSYRDEFGRVMAPVGTVAAPWIAIEEEVA